MGMLLINLRVICLFVSPKYLRLGGVLVLDKVVATLQMVVSGVATVGSILIHHDTETGKDSVNLIPATLWVYGLVTVGCSLTTGEPFSQCVKSVFSIIGG